MSVLIFGCIVLVLAIVTFMFCVTIRSEEAGCFLGVLALFLFILAIMSIILGIILGRESGEALGEFISYEFHAIKQGIIDLIVSILCLVALIGLAFLFHKIFRG